jgi:oligopeptide transport system substrate-binding protein
MAVTAVTSLALLAAACGGGGGTEPEPGTSQPAGATGGEVTIRGCTPENPLIPGATSEVCGGDIIDAMTSKLIRYNTETAAPEMDIAESIESEDNQTFTVKLKPGYKFHDGTDVKAKNFVDAWNYTTYGPNGQAGSYFYSAFDGFADLQCGTDADGAADCEGSPPKAKELPGLKVVDDLTFTMKTSEPVSNLPVRLGYSAFAPLPDSFFADRKAFEEKPIGAGPFKLDSKSTTEFVLSKFADFSGTVKPSIDKLTFRVYADDAAAYADVVANNLDYTNHIPDDQLVGEAYKTDLDGRNAERETGGLSWIVFSPNDPQFEDNVPLRKAISKAIDRDLIAQQIFQGTRTTASGWVSPVVDGYKPGVCGDPCVFDAAKAKADFEAAGGYDGTLTMTYNADSPNKAWSEAVCNSIKNALGIECTAVPVVDFATFNKQIDAREIKGIHRAAWQMDYPSIENFLAPLYAKNADSNWPRYDSPEFNQLLTQAAAAPTTEEANALYQQAEALLAEDFPTAPLWYGKTIVGYSDKVTDVKINAFGVLDFTAIKVK